MYRYKALLWVLLWTSEFSDKLECQVSNFSCALYLADFLTPSSLQPKVEASHIHVYIPTLYSLPAVSLDKSYASIKSL